MPGFDYDTYYKYLSYQRWLEEKKRRERRRKLAGVLVAVVILTVAVYLSLPAPSPGKPSGSEEYTGLKVPARVKVIPNGGIYLATFSVYFSEKPPMLVVTNAPNCKVSFSSGMAVLKCVFDSFASVPGAITLFDGVRYYTVALDKYAVANFVKLPDGGLFSYNGVAYYGDNVSVSFSVVSDRPLVRPTILAYGVSRTTYKYTVLAENGLYHYDFKAELHGVRSSEVKLTLTAVNLKELLSAVLKFKLVKRVFNVQPLFDEPVVVRYGTPKTIAFSVATNYDTLVRVSVINDRYVHAISPGSVPVMKGGSNVVSVTLYPGNVTDVEKTVMTVVLSDGHFSKEFSVPVIVMPRLRFSVAGLNSTYNPDGSINVTVLLVSSVGADAVVKYSSSPATYSPDFPMSVKLRKGLNSLSFTVKNLPGGVGELRITLTLDLYAYGTRIATVNVGVVIKME